MNHVICFCYSMHGCCIGSEYKPPKHEKLHENNGDVSCLSRGVPISRIPLGYTMVTPGYFDFFIENTNCVL